MFDIECPWCAGPATVEVAESDESSARAAQSASRSSAGPVGDPLAQAA